MKKIILLTIIVGLGFVTTSCMKYDCTCTTYTYDNTTGDYVISGTTTSSTTGATRTAAENKCDSKSTGITMECE